MRLPQSEVEHALLAYRYATQLCASCARDLRHAWIEGDAERAAALHAEMDALAVHGQNMKHWWRSERQESLYSRGAVSGWSDPEDWDPCHAGRNRRREIAMRRRDWVQVAMRHRVIEGRTRPDPRDSRHHYMS